MTKYFREFASKDFGKFIITGGIAAAVNFGTRLILSKYISFISAICLAYIIGMLVAFVLSRLFVFNAAEGRPAKQLFYFTLVNVLAIIQTVGVSVGLVQYVLPQVGINHYREEFAHFAGITIPVFTSYLGHKYISFARQKKKY